MSKLRFGRKFLVMVMVTVVLVGILVVAAFKMPDAVNSAVLITYGTLIMTTGMAYIGGNVWKSWVKSKHFKQELQDK